MSAAARAAIATAASAVAGVDVSPYMRQITKPGQGFVRYDHTDYPNRFGGLTTWQVVVMLSQDTGTAERWLDQDGPALKQAVAGELIVRSMTPVQLALPDVGSLLCVVIEGQREEE